MRATPGTTEWRTFPVPGKAELKGLTWIRCFVLVFHYNPPPLTHMPTNRLPLGRLAGQKTPPPLQQTAPGRSPGRHTATTREGMVTFHHRTETKWREGECGWEDWPHSRTSAPWKPGRPQGYYPQRHRHSTGRTQSRVCKMGTWIRLDYENKIKKQTN